MGEGGGAAITTGHSPLENGDTSRHGQGRGQGQGQEPWGSEMSIESPDTERMDLAAVVNDAVEAIAEGDGDNYQSTRKLSLTARRTAFLDFLAKTEYHQASPGEEQLREEEDDDDDDDETVTTRRHFSFSEVLGINKNIGRHNSVA